MTHLTRLSSSGLGHRPFTAETRVRSSLGAWCVRYGVERRPWEGERFEDADYVDEAFCWWLSGFLDGEGCFSISRSTKGCYSCALIVKLRADDRPLLEQIQFQLGIGIVRGVRVQGEGRRRPAAHWVVARKAETLWLTKLLDEFTLRAKKARDYAVWREAVICLSAGGNREEMAGYFHEIRRVREYAE